MKIFGPPLFFFATLFLIFCNSASSQNKYGTRATPLSISREHFKESAAPDFWSLIGFYVPQFNEAACSVASITMVTNGARGSAELTSEDPLLEQTEVLKKSEIEFWNTFVNGMGKGATLSLDSLEGLLRKTFELQKIKILEVKTLRAVDPKSKEWDRFQKDLHELLIKNEASNKDFIIANFDQKAFLEDASVGHLAPVGAYDSKRKRVLILDPDRKWYEPYWVSEEVFAQGLATLDSSVKKLRGVVWVRFERAK